MFLPQFTLLSEMGAILLFGLQALKSFFRFGVRWRAVVDQMYAVGVRSLFTTVTTGLFVGAIMAIQLDLQLKDFGAQMFLGGLSASVTIRNVGPVLIAFILSGKVGAYTSAELGTMQVTDQINAIRCLGADPIRYLVVPRMLAVVVTSFLLLIVGLVMAIGGGALIASLQLGVNETSFLANIPRIVSWWSVGTGVVKSFVFGAIIAVICCYQGYHTRGGSVGVGETVKRTAVQTLVSIIVADFALSSLASALRDLGESFG
jgi:phospholipid/cholesterol/gamma-HCH transport system permease protein